MFLTLVGSSCSVAKGKLRGLMKRCNGSNSNELLVRFFLFLTAKTFEIQRFIDRIYKEKARSPWKEKRAS
jgi:hypothetical protein